MENLNDLLNQCGVFFLATVDGEQPKLRPIAAHTEEQNIVHFYIGKNKKVYEQLTKNPHCEIGGMIGKAQWLRITGRAVFDTDTSYAINYLNNVSPGLKNIYNQKTGHQLVSFHLEDMDANLFTMGHLVKHINSK